MLLLSTLLMLISSTGCSEAGSPLFGGSGSGDEEEHLEHVIPPHKPRKCRDLVSAISDRVSQLAAESSTPDRKIVLRQELNDVIAWIPETAADSDLLKSDWEKAADIGRKLQIVFRQCYGETAPVAAAADAMQRFAPYLDELRVLAEKSEVGDISRPQPTVDDRGE